MNLALPHSVFSKYLGAIVNYHLELWIRCTDSARNFLLFSALTQSILEMVIIDLLKQLFKLKTKKNLTFIFIVKNSSAYVSEKENGTWPFRLPFVVPVIRTKHKVPPLQHYII